MTPARAAILREAQHECAMLRRAGYPDARVMPEHCSGGDIGHDHIMTKTVSVYAGEYKPETIPRPIRKALEKATAQHKTI